jgi:hypothetical protein
LRDAGGTRAQAQRMAAHASLCTTTLAARPGDAITRDEGERRRMERMDGRMSVRSARTHRGPSTGEHAMHWIIATMLAVMALGSVTAHAMTGGSVEAKFRGTSVPASAACTSPLKLVIEATKSRS